MRRIPLDKLGVAFFAIAFALVNSGASTLLVSMMDSRPEWSRCGMDLCSCVPVDPGEGCPLCALGLMDNPSDTCPAQTPRRAPIKKSPKGTEAAVSIDGASSAASAAVFIGVVLCGSQTITPAQRPGDRWVIERARVPDSRRVGPPAPPPRA